MSGAVKRLRGVFALSHAAMLCIVGVPRLGELAALDILLLAALLLVLLVDGTLNALAAVIAVVLTVILVGASTVDASRGRLARR